MLVGFDTETEIIGDCNLNPQLVCVSLAWADSTDLIHHSDPRLLECLRNLLKNHTLAIHNSSFDLWVIARKYPELIPEIFQSLDQQRVICTETNARLISIAAGNYQFLSHVSQSKNRNFSLGTLMRKLFGVELDKCTWRLRYGELIDSPISQWPQGAIDYAVDDARSHLRLAQHQLAKCAQYILPGPLQVRRHFAARATSLWGLPVDSIQLEKLIFRVESELEILLEDLEYFGFVYEDKNGDRKRSLKTVRQYIRETQPSPILTGKGELVTSEVACREYDDQILIDFARFTKLSALKSKDISLLSRPHGVHPRYVMANTLRTRTQRPNTQNIQNEPGVRECFVPPEGFLWAIADYDGIESRTFAQICMLVLGYSKMGEAIKQGKDIHLLFAAKIRPEPYDELVDMYADKTHPLWKKIWYARQSGKVFNFAGQGGGGALAMVDYAKDTYKLEMSLDYAKKCQAEWKILWPEVGPYFRWISSHNRPGVGHCVQQPFSGHLPGGMTFTQATNMSFQHLAGCLTGEAHYELVRACTDHSVGSILLGSQVNNFIHDEFIMAVRDDEFAHERAEEMARIMCAAGAPFVPDFTLTAEALLATHWSKLAERIEDSNGRIIPWTIS